MISNMLRFPFSMLDENFETLFYPERVMKTQASNYAEFPAINIGTTETRVDVYAFVPGLQADQIEMVIEKNMLSISGERKLPELSEQENKVFRQERFEGSFKRVITLPETVDAESANATYKDGVLHISIAKQAESKPRQIKVSVH